VLITECKLKAEEEGVCAGVRTPSLRSLDITIPPALNPKISLLYFLTYDMKKAVYPGTFDPITYGHLDVIKRGSKIFDELIVTVGHNPLKNPIFTVEERMEMLSENTSEIQNTKVDCFEGILTDYMEKMLRSLIHNSLLYSLSHCFL